jgi:hypothetical protein
VTNIYNYFHNFKKPVKYAAIKIKDLIENGQSFKLRQMCRVNMLSLSSTTSTQQKQPQASTLLCCWLANFRFDLRWLGCTKLCVHLIHGCLLSMGRPMLVLIADVDGPLCMSILLLSCYVATGGGEGLVAFFRLNSPGFPGPGNSAML